MFYIFTLNCISLKIYIVLENTLHNKAFNEGFTN